MTKYSQNDEQDHLLNYFQGQTGRFLDIGACDGESYSNTRALALNGWGGVLIEPSFREFTKLYEIYHADPKYTLIHAAVTTDWGLHKFHHSNWVAFGTLDERWYLANQHHNWHGTYMVASFPVKMLESFGPFDFINIDAEGMDWEIATQLPVSLLEKTKAISVEHPRAPIPEWSMFFEKYGLTKVIAKNNENLILGR